MEVLPPKTSSKCPCLAWPGPVEMLKTAGHGQGKSDTGNSERIDLFGKLPFVNNILSLELSIYVPHPCLAIPYKVLKNSFH